MQSQENIAVLIAIGCLAMLVLVIAIIMFVAVYQRKILLKEAKIQLMEQEKQLELFRVSIEAEEQQKEKIARNLHDEINPILSVLKFNLSKHRIQIQKNTFDPESLKADTTLLDKAIEGIRSSCLDLIPSFLIRYGLIKALEDYVTNLQTNDSLATQFQSSLQETDLSSFEKQDQLNIYRMCLEILNNLIKHSNSKNLQLSLSSSNQKLVVQFIHDGKSVSNAEMDDFTEKSTGLGLKSLKSRAMILSATINYTKNDNLANVNLTIPYKNV